MPALIERAITRQRFAKHHSALLMFGGGLLLCWEPVWPAQSAIEQPSAACNAVAGDGGLVVSHHGPAQKVANILVETSG
jgi:hypothetical protein